MKIVIFITSFWVFCNLSDSSVIPCEDGKLPSLENPAGEIEKQPTKNIGEDEKIIGGVNANPNEFPYIVSIQVYKMSEVGERIPTQYCDGTILNSEYVLTAGHCCGIFVTSKYSILAGAHDQSSFTGSEQRVSVWQVYRNKKYNEETIDYDICVMQVFPTFKLNEFVQKVSLPTSDSIIQGTGVAAGWGITSNNATSTPNVLQKIFLPIVPHDACAEIYQEVNPVTPRMMCSGYDEGKNVCHGDSGGPLICTDKNNKEFQCGIVSWGVGCAYEGYPGVFTSVQYFANWIKCKIDKGFMCDLNYH